LNEIIRGQLEKIKEYEHEWEYFEERRKAINATFPMHKESEEDVFNRGYKKGFAHGYQKGQSQGFFKGSVESQYLGVQKGIEEGIHDGFNFGFDEGFKTGIRIVFRDAREKNIDLDQLDLIEYISREDRIKAE